MLQTTSCLSSALNESKSIFNDINEDYEKREEIKGQNIPGSVKTSWAMNYKVRTDMELERSIERKEKVRDKRKTKGMFSQEHKNNSGHWMVDRDWYIKANKDFQIKE